MKINHLLISGADCFVMNVVMTLIFALVASILSVFFSIRADADLFAICKAYIFGGQLGALAWLGFCLFSVSLNKMLTSFKGD